MATWAQHTYARTHARTHTRTCLRVLAGAKCSVRPGALRLEGTAAVHAIAATAAAAASAAARRPAPSSPSPPRYCRPQCAVAAKGRPRCHHLCRSRCRSRHAAPRHRGSIAWPQSHRGQSSRAGPSHQRLLGGSAPGSLRPCAQTRTLQSQACSTLRLARSAAAALHVVVLPAAAGTRRRAHVITGVASAARPLQPPALHSRRAARSSGLPTQHARVRQTVCVCVCVLTSCRVCET